MNHSDNVAYSLRSTDIIRLDLTKPAFGPPDPGIAAPAPVLSHSQVCDEEEAEEIAFESLSILRRNSLLR